MSRIGEHFYFTHKEKAMSLGIVNVHHDQTKGIVTIQSDLEDGSLAIQELSAGAAKNLAITAAAQAGLPDPRVEPGVAPYAVDANGEIITPSPKSPPIAAYRVDVAVTRRLV